MNSLKAKASKAVEASSQRASYSQILKSSSIVGGSTGLNYVISMIRFKAVALLLGPEGVGLVGLYQSMSLLIRTFAGMGIETSGVRDVAQAVGTEDPARVATTTRTLRRTCWVTGVIGCGLTIALAYPLSLWTFESSERAWPIAFLGITVLIGCVSAGQRALLQGTRKIADLARVNVWSAVVGTLVAIAVYSVFGQKGIVPVLILTASANLIFSWIYARRISLVAVNLSWSDTWKNSKSLLSLGLAFMWGALLAAAVALVIRAVIVRDLGLDAAGVYTAAWSITGMLAGIVLTAMFADFYPRLTAVADDNDQVNQLLNEQLEIGTLLTLPSLLATLAFAPQVMRIFFSEKFVAGGELLPWFVLGVLLQIIVLPLGMIQRARGETRWIFCCNTAGHVIQLVFTLVLIAYCGLLGTAVAMPCRYLIQFVYMLMIARHLSRFRYSPASLRVQGLCIAIIILAFAVSQYLPEPMALVTGGILAAIGTVYSLRGICNRVGPSHRIIRLICMLPGGRIACGV